MTALFDKLAVSVAIAAIRIYQVVGSRMHNRMCLFAPTCSHRAIAYFREQGFREGLAATRRQLKECRGTYSLRLDSNGDVEMISDLGTVFPPSEVSPVIKAKLLFFNPMAMSAAMSTNSAGENMLTVVDSAAGIT